MTVQGEGANTGRPAVFCRFSGCNLWSGREPERPAALCRFCDTDFVGTDGPGGGKYEQADALAEAIDRLWSPGFPAAKLVVCTGGEPLLQLNEPLLARLHDRGIAVAVETNGTIAAPHGLDWICVSPKYGQSLVQNRGDELKLIYPQDEMDPASFERLDFRHFFLQPMDGSWVSRSASRCIDYCRQHPRWQLSLQTHKIAGIP